MTRTVEDAALLFMACAGYDRARSLFRRRRRCRICSRRAKQDVKGLRVAYSPTLGYAKCDAEVLRVIEAAVKQFENLGCHVEQVDRVFAADPVDIWSAEFYAGAGTRLRPFLENKRELLDPAVADILDQALRQDLRDYYGKVFERYALRDALNPFFERYDILLSPTLPVTSLDAGKNVPDHLGDRNLVSWVYYTYPFNVTGQPAATVCAGIAADGMPVGLQIVGRALGEYDVVRAAAAYERSQPKGYNVRAVYAALISLSSACVSAPSGDDNSSRIEK